MLSPLQSAYTQHFLHRGRLIKVELLGRTLYIMDNYTTNEISLDFGTYFSTEEDDYGNLTNISIFGGRVAHLGHSNPTVLEQWASLLHQYVHKVGFHKDYKLLEKIGEGVSGCVYLGKEEKTGNKVAIKAFCKRKMQAKDWIALQNQINVQRLAESRYFPKLIATYLTQKTVYLVMEYVSGINLKELIEKYVIDLQQKKRILQQIATSLSILHKKQIVHRDIKPQNIIYNKNTKQIRIIDFGFSAYLPQKSKSYSNCGTPGYTAPQTFNKDYEPTPANDVFSLGVVAHFLFTGKLPFRQGGRSILVDSRDCQFAFSPLLSKNPSLLTLIKLVVCHESSRISLNQFNYSDFFALNYYSSNNPQAKLVPKKHENLSMLNDKVESYCARQRCSSINMKTRSKFYEPQYQKAKNRLITERF